MNTIFTAFKEHKDFSPGIPWSVLPTHFSSDEDVPPHYADTIELLLFCDCAGEIRIGGHRYSLSGKQVFFIPPEVVHAASYKKSNGLLLNVKLSLDGLAAFMDLPALMNVYGQSFSSLKICPPCYDEVLPAVMALCDTDDLFTALSSIMTIFSHLRQYGVEDSLSAKGADEQNAQLRAIINWTSAHLHQKITVDDAAHTLGYSKAYFCSKFRASTGITYLTYVNSARISRACHLLKCEKTVAETAELCGFSDVPYFISLFKKIKGVTPKKYAQGQ